MAQTGLEYLVCAPIKSESYTAVAYDKGMNLARAIKVDMSVEINDVPLYADNRIVESIKKFKSGKVTVNGDHLTYEGRAMLLGHTVTEITGGGKRLTAKGTDKGAFVGIGFFATNIKNNVAEYRAVWLPKVKFGIPGENFETENESLAFKTPSIEGTIMLDQTDTWLDEATLDSAEKAREWLNSKANYTPPEPEAEEA